MQCSLVRHDTQLNSFVFLCWYYFDKKKNSKSALKIVIDNFRYGTKLALNFNAELVPIYNQNLKKLLQK